MPLIREEDVYTISADEFLECVQCGSRFDDPDELMDWSCPDCKNEGFIRKTKGRSRKISERWDDDILGRGYFVLPAMLLDRAGDLRLTTNELIVLIAQERYRMSAAEEVFPSETRLARLTCLSVSTVKRSIKSLRAKELIEIVRRRRRNGGFAVNHYTRHGLDAALLRLACDDAIAALNSGKRGNSSMRAPVTDQVEPSSECTVSQEEETLRSTNNENKILSFRQRPSPWSDLGIFPR
jgi:predicted  nucleic acid-binding Zn-ribbon protein